VQRMIGYKFRVYPTEEQKSFFADHFGCCRFVYNYFLWLRSTAYKRFGVSTSFYQLKKRLPGMKKSESCSFLKHVNSQSLQEALIDLEKAFQRFFKNLGEYPRFKKKFHKQTFKVPQSFSVKMSKRGNYFLYIPKLKSGVKIKIHRSLDGTSKQLTISKTSSGKYYASINCEALGVVKVTEPKREDGAVDLGLISFVVKDNGEKICSPRPMRRLEKLVVAACKRFSRKIKGSANWEKARLELANVMEKISNKRRDFLHKESLKLVIENQVTYIEDLHVKGMMKNHCLAKSIADASWSEFVRMLIYKALWRGREVKKIGRFEATSKTCSNCGVINNNLTLSNRIWKCEQCCVVHDRDVNAAKNILKIGRKMSLGQGMPEVKSVERSTNVFSFKLR